MRRFGLAALALVLVIGASGCSGGVVGNAPAATINGVKISQDQLFAATEATTEFYEYSIEAGQDTQGQLSTVLADLQGAGPETLGMAGTSQVLGDMIHYELLRQELKANDALPTKEAIKTIRDGVAKDPEGLKILESNPEYIDLYVDRASLDDAYTQWLAAEADKDLVALTPEEREERLQALYEEIKPTRPLCLNIIQTEDEASAAGARERVDAGEDFVTVAADFVPEGTEVPDEGFIACLAFEQAQAAFGVDLSTSEVGDLVGPVAYTDQEGAAPVYLVMRVEGFDGPTYEQIAPELEAQVPVEPTPTDPASIDPTTALLEFGQKAEVDVNRLFGTWNPVLRTVDPPVVPVEPTTPESTTTLPVTTTIPVVTGP